MPGIVGGAQHRWDSNDEMGYDVDTVNPDHPWSAPIIRALRSF